MAKYKAEDLLISTENIKRRDFWFKEYKYFLVYSSTETENWEDSNKTDIEYYGKASLSSKPTFKSNHIFKWITEDEITGRFKLSITEVLKKL